MSEESTGLIKFTEDHKDEAKALITLVKADDQAAFVSQAGGFLTTLLSGSSIAGKLVAAGLEPILARTSYFALHRAVEADAKAFEEEQAAQRTLEAIGHVVEAAVSKVLHDEELYEQLDRKGEREFFRRYDKFETQYPELFEEMDAARSATPQQFEGVRAQLVEMGKDSTFIRRATGQGTAGLVFDFGTIRMGDRAVFFDDSGDFGLGK